MKQKVFYDIPMPGEFEGKLFKIRVGTYGEFPADSTYYVSGKGENSAKWNLRDVIGFNYQQIKTIDEIKF